MFSCLCFFWYSCCLLFRFFDFFVFLSTFTEFFRSDMYISFFCLGSNGLSSPGGVIEFNFDGQSKNKPSAGRTQPYSVPQNATRSTFGADCYPYPKSHLAFLAPDLFTCAFSQISDRDRQATLDHVLASITSVADNLDGNSLFIIAPARF